MSPMHGLCHWAVAIPLPSQQSVLEHVLFVCVCLQRFVVPLVLVSSSVCAVYNRRGLVRLQGRGVCVMTRLAAVVSVEVRTSKLGHAVSLFVACCFCAVWLFAVCIPNLCQRSRSDCIMLGLL